MKNTHLLREVNNIKNSFEIVIDNLIEQIEDLESDNNILIVKVDTLEKIIEDLDEECQKLTDDVNDKDNEISALKQKIEDLLKNL